MRIVILRSRIEPRGRNANGRWFLPAFILFFPAIPFLKDGSTRMEGMEGIRKARNG
jgi:hypothetical protein